MAKFQEGRTMGYLGLGRADGDRYDAPAGVITHSGVGALEHLKLLLLSNGVLYAK